MNIFELKEKLSEAVDNLDDISQELMDIKENIPVTNNVEKDDIRAIKLWLDYDQKPNDQDIKDLVRKLVECFE